MLAKYDSGWWKGEMGGGAEGMFPSTYVASADESDKGGQDVMDSTAGLEFQRVTLLDCEVGMWSGGAGAELGVMGAGQAGN